MSHETVDQSYSDLISLYTYKTVLVPSFMHNKFQLNNGPPFI